MSEDRDDISDIPLPESPDDELRRLRLRRLLQPTRFALEAPGETTGETNEDDADNDNSSPESQIPDEGSEVEEDELHVRWARGEEDHEEAEIAIDERLYRFSESLGAMGDDIRSVSEEVRRMGREMFKTNRAAERNQEVFDEAIREINRLNSTVALIPAQHESVIAETRFNAKADLCRELLRLSDTLEASIAAADIMIDGVRNIPKPADTGFAFRFAATRRMRESLIESLDDSVAALQQWRDGQRLLAERLRAILQSSGLREIETMGRTFDPSLHRAVSTIARTDVPAGTIAGEELKGYTLEGRILRYAEVVVAKHE